MFHLYHGTVTKKKPNGEANLGLIKFFFPNFKIINGPEYFSDYEGVIFNVGSSSEDFKKATAIKEMGVPYIFISNSFEVDLSNRGTMLEFVYGRRGKKVPKYVDEMKDQLDEKTFLELVKVCWLTGNWSLKEYEKSRAFLELIDTFRLTKKDVMIKFANVINNDDISKVESSLLSFLLRVENEENTPTGYYGETIMRYRRNKSRKNKDGKYGLDLKFIEDAVMNNITSVVDNSELRLLNFVLSLK